MQRENCLTLRRRSHWLRVEPYLYVLPALMFLLAMVLYPIMYLADLSVRKATMLRPPMPYIGSANFERVLSSSDFLQALWQTSIWTFASVVITGVLGLVSALLLHEKFRGRGLMRMLILLPWVFPYVAAAIMWRFLLTQPFGYFDAWLHAAGLIEPGIGALGSSGTAMVSAIVVNSWKHFPFIMLMLLAGLQAIPEDLDAAARVDGASWFQRLAYITIPMLRPVMFSSLLIFVIWSLNAFSIIFLLTDGGPGKATEIVPLHIYRLSFVSFEFGTAAAASAVLFMLGLVLASVYVRRMKEDL